MGSKSRRQNARPAKSGSKQGAKGAKKIQAIASKNAKGEAKLTSPTRVTKGRVGTKGPASAPEADSGLPPSSMANPVAHEGNWEPPASPSKRGRGKGHPFSGAAAAWLKGGPGEQLDNGMLRACRWRESIGSVKCEVFEIERQSEPEQGKKPVRVIIVPGNPGVCAYYVRTAKKIWGELGGRVSVSAVSYLGFPTEASDAKLVSLPEEAVHLASVLHAMHERFPGEEFVLVGHSIGCWLCTEAMKGMPELPIVRAGLVFPFNCVGRDKFRKQNWLDTRSWPFFLRPVLHSAFFAAGQLGSVLSIMSGWQQRLLLNIFGSGASQDKLCSEVTLEYIGRKPHILRSLFFLGKTEMYSLPRPENGKSAWCDKELGSYEAISHKLHWLYTTEPDNWAPIEQAKEVKSTLPKSVVDIEDGVKQ